MSSKGLQMSALTTTPRSASAKGHTKQTCEILRGPCICKQEKAEVTLTPAAQESCPQESTRKGTEAEKFLNLTSLAVSCANPGRGLLQAVPVVFGRISGKNEKF